MAYIGHRCACRHSDLDHSISPTTNRRRRNGSPCKRRCSRRDQPELLPTLDPKARPIEAIVPPGQGLATEGGRTGPKTCDCDACRQLYTELTGIELPATAAA